MSDSTIPLWKQELLKRKQGKLTHEKLISAQKESNSKLCTNELDHRSAGTNRCQIDGQHGSTGINSNLAEKGATYDVYNRANLLDKIVDVSDTRQESGKSRISSALLDTGPSRLDSFENSFMSNNENVGKYSKNSRGNSNNFVASGSSRIPGMSQNTRRHSIEENISMIEEGGLKDRLQETGEDKVDTEHIRINDVKKMWQNQAAREEKRLKSPTRSKSLSSMAKHKSEGIALSHNDLSITQVKSSTSVPKAYHSPYAKMQWHRQTDDKSVKRTAPVPLLERNEVKSHQVESTGSSVSTTSQNEIEDDQVEHIQSVKSLLGLFGGKAKPNMSRKISDNVSLGNKTDRQLNRKDYHVTGLTNSASKRPGLFKHHSEPNLCFSVERSDLQSSKKSPTEIVPRKSLTSEMAPEDVVQPSHNVSQGIQNRMTRLRKASHSSMEDMDELIEFEQNSNEDMKSVGEHSEAQKDQYGNIVATKNPINEATNNTCGIVQIGKHDEEKLPSTNGTTLKPNDNEKQMFPSKVNTDNAVTSAVVGDAPNLIKHQHLEENKKTDVKNGFENKDNLQDQSFGKLSSVFGPRIVKKQGTGSDMTDTNQGKSENKYQNKHSIHVLKKDQSHVGLDDQVMSTEYTSGIKQSKQELKTIIKGEENINKSEKKPRKKGLTVVDPLAVLQLTRDPILIKDKTATDELGLLKESQSGRKPNVKIIKHEPDNKSKIAQINRAWDLDKTEPALKQKSAVGQRSMPASSVHEAPHIPVTSIDEIPVSVINDSSKSKSSFDHSQKEGKVSNATFYNGLLSDKIEMNESDEDLIPVSSIDVEDLGPPPEVVFDKMPEMMKSCFTKNGLQKRGKISFFEHVFIHDYQSEAAATSDWDFENGASFSSYTPAAVKSYEDKSHGSAPTSQPQAVTPPTPPEPEKTRYDEALITYNEDESVDFTGSSDGTAGALLF